MSCWAYRAQAVRRTAEITEVWWPKTDLWVFVNDWVGGDPASLCLLSSSGLSWG